MKDYLEDMGMCRLLRNTAPFYLQTLNPHRTLVPTDTWCKAPADMDRWLHSLSVSPSEMCKRKLPSNLCWGTVVPRRVFVWLEKEAALVYVCVTVGWREDSMDKQDRVNLRRWWLCGPLRIPNKSTGGSREEGQVQQPPSSLGKGLHLLFSTSLFCSL